MNPEPDDEMPPEYDFDYSKAKPNRFADPDYPLRERQRTEAQPRNAERFGMIEPEAGLDEKPSRNR